MGPRFLGPVRWFPGAVWLPWGRFRAFPGFPGSVPPTFYGCRASMGRWCRFRRLSAGSGLPGCRWSCLWAVFGLPALVFCMVGGCRLPAAAFVVVGGQDPAAIYTYTRARRGSCRVESWSDGKKPVQQFTRACSAAAGGVQSQTGAGRFDRRAISNGSRKILEAACNPFRIRFMEKNQIYVLKMGPASGRGSGAGLLIGGAGGAAWEILVRGRC